MGAALPRTLMPPDDGNAHGYFESAVIYKIHTRFLVAMDSEWDDFRPLPPDWWLTGTAKDFEDELAEAVVSEFGDAPLFVLKDPRMCRLLPLWKRIFDRVGAIPLYVVPVRNPLEVADSLYARDGFPFEKSLLIWLRHLLEGELESRGARRSFVAFTALLEDWPRAVQKIASDLGIVWPRRREACDVEVVEFLATNLRHHRIPDRVALESPTVPRLVRRAYSAAISASNGSPEAIEGMLSDLAIQLGDADQLLVPLLDSFDRRQRALQEDLRAAREDAAWQQSALKEELQAAREDAARQQSALKEELQAARNDADRRQEGYEATVTLANSTIAELHRTKAEAEQSLTATRALLAMHEVERATFGAQVGRWLTRRHAQLAPPGSIRGRLVSGMVRGIRRLYPG